MYQTMFPRDLFAEFDRLQREVSSLFDLTPSIRGLSRGGYPALNVGLSPSSVEVYAFAPGLDPASIEVNLDRGVLSLAGERKTALPQTDERTTVHMEERFAGHFRRVVSLPDDIDPESVSAAYTDGVLRATVKRREAAQPRRIAVQ
jgi:HSP20 family protein